MRTAFSSRSFNQEVGKAKKEAEKGPVFITDRGRPTHVLLSVREYERLKAKGKFVSIADALAMGEEGDFEFEIPERKDFGLKVPDFS